MEQRVIVRFLTLKELSMRDITAELKGVKGHEPLSFGGEEVAQVVRQSENHPGGRLTVGSTASNRSL
jgi:hypothetical protein